ncbi:MAG: hypothetical protein WCL29_08430, partial [Pseudomonadota bacterium]
SSGQDYAETTGYSPMPLPDGSGFSAVRVITPDPNYGAEATIPPVWRYGWDGTPVTAMIDTRRVGYYAWVNDQQAVMFIVDEVAQRNAHYAVLVDRETGKSARLTDKPGRSFGRTPDGKRATFVDQSDPKHWVIAAMGIDDTKPTVLVETIVGAADEKDRDRSQYYCWLPDGSILMANGGKFFRWDGNPGNGFKLFADPGDVGGAIRNIAVSRDGSQLVFSVQRAVKNP